MPARDLSALRAEQLDLLLRNAREYAIFTMDPGGTVVLWNAGAEALLGWTEHEAVGQPGALVFTDEQRARGVPEAEMATAAREGQAEDQRWHRRKDGSLFWANGMLIALRDGTGGAGGLRGFAKVLRDDTRAKAYQDDLEALNQTLEARIDAQTAHIRSLAAALEDAEARERRRMSALLHDDLQQQLYGVRLVAGRLLQDLQSGGSEGREGLLGHALQIQAWTESALALTRRLAASLVVPGAQEARLGDAAASLAEQAQARFGLDVALDLDPEADVPDPGARALVVRALQELLFNVVKHAGVGRAALVTRALPRAVEIRVEDRGRGFDASAAGPDTLGLPGVRHRVALAGGEVEVDSAPGGGCRIRILLPCPSPVGPAERQRP